ncbi:hypothetical protein RHECNPAF_1740078 [Rhizobium etli CNPAF512]|nr:hypothetical protein RHECNPAF_1740078 [Rhizobium etli CNPAF512]
MVARPIRVRVTIRPITPTATTAFIQYRSLRSIRPRHKASAGRSPWNAPACRSRCPASIRAAVRAAHRSAKRAANTTTKQAISPPKARRASARHAWKRPVHAGLFSCRGSGEKLAAR